MVCWGPLSDFMNDWGNHGSPYKQSALLNDSRAWYFINLAWRIFKYKIVGNWFYQQLSSQPFSLEYLRDLSSSLAAWAARSSPVGSKLLHLSLGLSPPPLEPPAGGGGGGGWDGRPGGTSGCPLFKPNSHDILKGINKGQFRGSVRQL